MIPGGSIPKQRWEVCSMKKPWVLPVSEILLLFLWVFLPCGLDWVCISHPLTAGLVSPGYL